MDRELLLWLTSVLTVAAGELDRSHMRAPAHSIYAALVEIDKTAAWTAGERERMTALQGDFMRDWLGRPRGM